MQAVNNLRITHRKGHGTSCLAAALLCLGFLGLVDSSLLDHAVRDGIGRSVEPAVSRVRQDLGLPGVR